MAMRKLNKLIDRTSDGILVGRVFFYYAFEDESKEDVNYQKAYVQPGVVTRNLLIMVDVHRMTWFMSITPT